MNDIELSLSTTRSTVQLSSDDQTFDEDKYQAMKTQVEETRVI
jgi:hypothetical protein